MLAISKGCLHTKMLDRSMKEQLSTLAKEMLNVELNSQSFYLAYYIEPQLSIICFIVAQFIEL